MQSLSYLYPTVFQFFNRSVAKSISTLNISYLFNQNKSSMFIEVVIAQFKVPIYLWYVLSIYILTTIIQSNIKLRFWFFKVLDTTDSTFHSVYQKFALTVQFMENMVCFRM